ncbi:uncharacterized protein K452DRAFT_8863 [Aplosporella prunicola CBS 121167]|uniref:Uncharacterized protein n=1 Tax=Aplosporella prunicola CBS 121167 TaxID=1176127 RepID=A0A6A6BW25_9PEZI|nr:uncharacterized protein K452DRAFT_8863 [Aplosporella prunicola CBS 121167]KAF2147553.1 hypothetical protein K452DRAFT_8863 [Aplosporella prunicola CBS 121167]
MASNIATGNTTGQDNDNDENQQSEPINKKVPANEEFFEFYRLEWHALLGNYIRKGAEIRWPDRRVQNKFFAWTLSTGKVQDESPEQHLEDDDSKRSGHDSSIASTGSVHTSDETNDGRTERSMREMAKVVAEERTDTDESTNTNKPPPATPPRPASPERASPAPEPSTTTRQNVEEGNVRPIERLEYQCQWHMWKYNVLDAANQRHE